MAYKLKLPETMNIHPSFHVSLLQAFNSNGSHLPPAPTVFEDDHLEHTVERVLDHKDRKFRKGSRRDFWFNGKAWVLNTIAGSPPVIALIAPSSLMNIGSIDLGLMILLLTLLLLFSEILRQLLRMLRWPDTDTMQAVKRAEPDTLCSEPTDLRRSSRRRNPSRR